MLSQLNPSNIVIGHLKTLGRKTPDEEDGISVFEVVLFLFTGVPFAVLQLIAVTQGYFLTSESVGIIVSAASIIAGLLLNLLVLVYTLVFNQMRELQDSRNLFKKIALHTFYNISFTVFSCLLLVVVCLMCMAINTWLRIVGNVLTFYLGPIVAVSLMMVLKKCHTLIGFYLAKDEV